MPRRAPSLRLLALAALTALVAFVPAAAAEMPENRDAPTITDAGGPVVGQLLNGNNGTWLYADGTGCRDECRYSFAWFRCVPGGPCSAVPGGGARAYRVSAADAGRSLRVVVTATKLDCNAIGQDCRLVSRTATSAETAPVQPAPRTVTRAPAARPVVTGASGVARIVLPARSVALAIRAERADATAAAMTVRLPAAR